MSKPTTLPLSISLSPRLFLTGASSVPSPRPGLRWNPDRQELPRCPGCGSGMGPFSVSDGQTWDPGRRRPLSVLSSSRSSSSSGAGLGPRPRELRNPDPPPPAVPHKVLVQSSLALLRRDQLLEGTAQWETRRSMHQSRYCNRCCSNHFFDGPRRRFSFPE